jgi:aspartate ammonia-lyase
MGKICLLGARPLALVLAVCSLAPSRSEAEPLSLREAVKRSVRRTVRVMRRAGRSTHEIRGAVQATMLRQLRAHRTRTEWKAMKAAGLDVPYREVRAFAKRELDSSIAGVKLPDNWDNLSPGRRFGVVYKALRRGYADARIFPDNWKRLDNASRYQVARCFAGNCSVTQGPAEVKKWLELTGTKNPASAKTMTGVEQMLSVRAGGSARRPRRYYGPETAKAMENFKVTGQPVPMDLIRSVAQIKAAAAIANMRAGTLDRKVGGAIIKAAREVMRGKHRDQFKTDRIQGGAGTSVNMNVNEVIAGRASEILTGRVDYRVVHPNDHVNMSQSTNDVYPTAIRVAAYKRLKGLLGSYELLAGELETKARQHRNTPKAGRTHLQDAVPIMMGREFGAYAKAIRRDIKAVKGAMKELTSVNMGGTAVGTALNAKPTYVKNVNKTLARISRVPVRQARDLVDATQNVDQLARAHGVLKVSASNLIKICNDLRMMNSGPRAGLGEITLPAVQKGSSIMPGKVNPVIAEVVNQIGYQVQGNDVTVNLVAQNGQFELNQMEPVLAHNLLQSIRILDRGARTLARKAIRGLRVNESTVRRQAGEMLGLATALAPHVGYDRAAELAKKAHRTGRPLHDVVVESGDLSGANERRAGRGVSSSAARVRKVLDPARMARGGVLE